MTQITSFNLNGVDTPVSFIEHQIVKEGVTCDIYAFTNDPSKDLAIVVVEQGFKTPLQKVLSGTETIEGYISGVAILTVTGFDGTIRKFDYPGSSDTKIVVNIGQTMQWEAKSQLTFYELCTPPYTDGRFENLTE